jgi:hypothetical protein
MFATELAVTVHAWRMGGGVRVSTTTTTSAAGAAGEPRMTAPRAGGIGIRLPLYVNQEIRPRLVLSSTSGVVGCRSYAWLDTNSGYGNHQKEQLWSGFGGCP